MSTWINIYRYSDGRREGVVCDTWLQAVQNINLYRWGPDGHHDYMFTALLDNDDIVIDPDDVVIVDLEDEAVALDEEAERNARIDALERRALWRERV